MGQPVTEKDRFSCTHYIYMYAPSSLLRWHKQYGNHWVVLVVSQALKFDLVALKRAVGFRKSRLALRGSALGQTVLEVATASASMQACRRTQKPYIDLTWD